MASVVIAFPVRVFDEEFYLLNNDSSNFLPFKLSMRLGWYFGGALGVQTLGYCLYGVLVEGGCREILKVRSFGRHFGTIFTLKVMSNPEAQQHKQCRENHNQSAIVNPWCGDTAK